MFLTLAAQSSETSLISGSRSEVSVEAGLRALPNFLDQHTLVKASNNAQFADKVRRDRPSHAYAPPERPMQLGFVKISPHQFWRPRANESAWRSCKEALACKRNARTHELERVRVCDPVSVPGSDSTLRLGSLKAPLADGGCCGQPPPGDRCAAAQTTSKTPPSRQIAHRTRAAVALRPG